MSGLFVTVLSKGIFINTRGNSKLFIYQNHTFRFMYKKAYGSQLWYCWYFFSRCCPAKLRINNAGKVTESIGRHNHDPPTCWMTPDGSKMDDEAPKADEETPHWSYPNAPQLTFIKRGGGTVLLYTNHQFVLKKRNKSGSECWECVNRRKKKCAGKLTIHGSDIIQEKKHTCLEDTPIHLANTRESKRCFPKSISKLKQNEDKLAERRLASRICKRRQYAEIKNNPVLLEIEREKRRKKYLKRKEIHKVPTRDLSEQRRRWRENSKRYRLKKKEDTIVGK
ncbi:hypothetical protein PYW07_016439 [Mythimna separata]|uniref:FLYWCH-type domain-containing protein n=1 Tax=Mythimna separata TaxID=271217 RepID=A0AAD7YL92_MYTSE|nr:hypothetical protein PYW07_016439 [Mythimna separata]